MSTKIMTLAKRFIPMVVGGYQLWYGEPNPGWGSVSVKIAQGSTKQALQSAIAGLSGIRLKGGGQATTQFDAIGTLNPVDLRNAPVPKVIMLSRLAMEGIDAVGKFADKLIKDILK